MCFSRTCALKRWVTATALRPSTAPWRWGRTCLSPAARCSTGLLLDWRIRLSSSRLLSVQPTIHSVIIHPLIQPLVSIHPSISYPSIHSPFHLRIGWWIDRLNIWTKKFTITILSSCKFFPPYLSHFCSLYNQLQTLATTISFTTRKRETRNGAFINIEKEKNSRMNIKKKRKKVFLE